MHSIGAFSFCLGAVFAGASLPWAAEASKFRGEPRVEIFPGGLRLELEVECPEPAALLGARVDFAFDFDLDGAFDPPSGSSLFPGDCAEGLLRLRRDLFPRGPGVLRVELRSGVDSLLDARRLFPAPAGALLALRRFCARPRNGEPEWVEVANVSGDTVSLAKVRLDGRALGGALGPGESVVAAGAADTAELRLWQPGARVFATSSWSPLRNSGDTVRLAFAASSSLALPLDSAMYAAAPSPREGCASTADEAAAAAAHGFELIVPSRARRNAPWSFEVRAPAGARYRARVFDLDGRARCAFDGTGPGRHDVSPARCPLPPSAAGALVHLRPVGAPATRARVRLSP